MLTTHAGPSMVGETRQILTELMLQHLPAHHREIIVATYFQGRTTREAARLLGLTHSAAATRLYEAMRALSLMVATSYADYPDPRAADWPEAA